MDVLTHFPVRKTKAQKKAFRDAVQVYADAIDYPVTVENGSFGSRNIVIGDPEKANYLLTAHYDTPARLPFPNFITPCNFLCYLGLQILQWLGIMIVSIFWGVAAGLLLKQPIMASLVGSLGVFVIVGLMLVGPANRKNANDNTSGVVTLLEVMRTLPENQRNKVCFVLFDLEEAGLLGSASYRKTHKTATDHQLVLNLDCVGDGDHIRFFPTKQLKKDRKRLTALYKACGYFGNKEILVVEKGFSVYPSDQKHFPYGVGICALNQGKCGLYLGRIHTARDTVLDQTNVNLLRAAIITFISGDAAQ